MSKIKEQMELRIRWMIRRDMTEIVDIEKMSFDQPWEEEDFLRQLRQRNCIGMVAEENDKIVGFMIYELHKARLHILNFAVATGARLRKVGEQMIDKLKSKLSAHRRSHITLEVRESNLAAHLFLRAQGFRCSRITKGHYDDTGEDAYWFDYHIPVMEEKEDRTPDCWR